MMTDNGHTTCPSASMSTPYPTWLDLGLNTDLRTANCLLTKDVRMYVNNCVPEYLMSLLGVTL
jgi:hypothetical protein